MGSDGPISVSSPEAVTDPADGFDAVRVGGELLAELALIAALGLYRHVTGRVAIGAAVLSVVFPPWIIPGAGVIVVTIARCIAFHRSFQADRPLSDSASVAADS